jgi:hypothetical protein
VKNRRITCMQDMRDLVLDTLGQFAREHDTEGLAEHLLSVSQHDGAEYYGLLLNQGEEDLVMVDEFWALARKYHHPTVGRPGREAGVFYEPPRHVSPKRRTPTKPSRAHA